MKKKEAESELEFLETSEDAKNAGLRRIKRRHFEGSKDILPSEELVDLKIKLDVEVADFFQSDPSRINSILRHIMDKEKVARELLEDDSFIKAIKDKLAA